MVVRRPIHTAVRSMKYANNLKVGHGTWMIHTTDAENDTDDKISDTTAGVVIMIFERMVDKVLDKGHVTYGMNLTNIIKIHSLNDIYTMYASDHNTKILCEYIQKVIEYKIRSIVVLCLFIYIIF